MSHYRLVPTAARERVLRQHCRHGAFTSVTCSQCRTRDREARESQAVFRCRACGYCDNDVNAARNIAAGQAVTARGGTEVLVPANREPQLSLLAS